MGNSFNRLLQNVQNKGSELFNRSTYFAASKNAFLSRVLPFSWCVWAEFLLPLSCSEIAFVAYRLCLSGLTVWVWVLVNFAFGAAQLTRLSSKFGFHCLSSCLFRDCRMKRTQRRMRKHDLRIKNRGEALRSTFGPFDPNGGLCFLALDEN